MRKRLMIWRRIVSIFALPMLLAVMLNGCAKTSTSVIDTSCEAFKPISYSSKDTDATVDQVIGHNAAWDALCLNGLDR